MANARAFGEARDVRSRISRVDQERRRAVCSLRGVEGSFFRGVYPAGDRRVRYLLRAVRAFRRTRSNGDSDRAATGLFFLVALCTAFVFASVDGNAGAADWPGGGDPRIGAVAVSLRGRGEKLEAATDRGAIGDVHRGDSWNAYASGRIHAVESAH